MIRFSLHFLSLDLDLDLVHRLFRFLSLGLKYIFSSNKFIYYVYNNINNILRVGLATAAKTAFLLLSAETAKIDEIVCDEDSL